MKGKPAEDGKDLAAQLRLMTENGQPGVEDNPQAKFYQQQTEQQQPPNDTQVSVRVRAMFRRAMGLTCHLFCSLP